MKKIFFIITIILSLHSCNDDILDLVPTDSISEATVWNDPLLIRAYHNAIYSGIDHAKGPNMMAKATDEMCYNAGGYPEQILKAILTPDNVSQRANFSARTASGGGSVYTWNKDYSIIREVLVFLDRMESDTFLSDDERAALVAEAKVIRAYMYSRLIVRFGGVPIIEDVFDANSDTSGITRNTIDECVAYIEADIAAAMPDLRDAAKSGEGEFGRATQSAAKAILSRMYLHLASPLFNPSNDIAKWQKAADAALDLIDDGLFSLHPDYTTLFNAPAGTANNELIWGRNYSLADGHSLPQQMLGRRFDDSFGGRSGSGGPSQNLVNDYDMTNGEPAFLKVNHVATVPNPASGYDPQNPYANRDPRFSQSILFNGTQFRDRTVESWEFADGSAAGPDHSRNSGDNPTSSYQLRKFMPDTDTQPTIGVEINFTSPFHFFRLGEIYLNYAEAMFELGEEQICRDYINLIRARPTVDMPPIPNTVTGEALRTRLYNERRIELAFEEHRYFDVRRWGIAKYTESQNLNGMKILVTPGEPDNYVPFSIVERAWDEKLNFIPIETNEILRLGGSVTQTPGY